MSKEAYKYTCSNCGREITTSPQMVGQSEPCPYCETRNTVGPKQQAPRPDTEDLHRSAKGAVVCAALSWLWVPVLFLSPFLLVLPVILGLAALALARMARRNMPPESDLAGPTEKLTGIALRVAIASLALLLMVVLIVLTTGYRPWPVPDAPAPGPEGPPEHSDFPGVLPPLSAGGPPSRLCGSAGITTPAPS